METTSRGGTDSDLFDGRMRDNLRAPRRRVVLCDRDVVEHAMRETRFVKCVDDDGLAPRRVFRGLEHDSVPTKEGDRESADGEDDWRIPRGDSKAESRG